MAQTQSISNPQVSTPASPPSPVATKIRAQLQGSQALVRVLMRHDMETGQRKDANGKLIAAWFIQEVKATLNGKPVFQAQWGTGMAKDPYLQFNLKQAKAGDQLTLQWLDNRGLSRSDSITLGDTP